MEDRELDCNGIPVPYLYGRPYYWWYKELGLKSIKEIEEYLDTRIDTIGQNGNDGLHYCPDQLKDV
jgi:hypothetical protein